MDSNCPRCGLPLPPNVNFCPSCGKKIKEPPPSASIGSQINVYFVSLFIPPFGLWYAYKYFKHGGGTEKKIGYAAIILTAISIGLTAWSAQILVNTVNQMLNDLNAQIGL